MVSARTGVGFTVADALREGASAADARFSYGRVIPRNHRDTTVWFTAPMTLEALEEAIDDLAENVSLYSDGPSVEALHRALSRLEAVVTHAAAGFDTSGEWALEGAKTPAAWLATRTRMPRREAHRRFRLAQALRHLPACEQAWRDGEVSSAHVDALAHRRRPGTEESLHRDEKLLVDQARTLRFEDFTRALAYWGQHADPDGSEHHARDLSGGRDVFITESFDGVWLGQMTLDPVSGAIVASELRRLEDELFEADWTEASQRLGKDPTSGDLERTSAQRRADALVEMATRSKSTPPQARRPAPLFSVLVGYETLHGRVCELAQGAAVTPGSLVPWIDRAYIERAVFELGPRVDVSATARLFTGATRRGLEIRDRRCTHPYCDRPAAECEADHIVPFAQGGPTTADNGRILCRFHNRLRNQRPPPPDP